MFYAVQKTTKIYRPMTKRVSANAIKGAPQKTKTIENDVLLGGVYVIRIEFQSGSNSFRFC